MYSHKVLQKRGRTSTDSSKCQLGDNPSTPPPCKLGIGVLGHLLNLASSAPEKLSAKCTLCSFNSSTPEFMFQYSSSCKLRSVYSNMNKLGSVYSNMNSGVLEPESVKFYPFSWEPHLKFGFLFYLKYNSECADDNLAVQLSYKDNGTYRFGTFGINTTPTLFWLLHCIAFSFVSAKFRKHLKTSVISNFAPWDSSIFKMLFFMS